MQGGKLCRGTPAGLATSGKVRAMTEKMKKRAIVSPRLPQKAGSIVAEPSSATRRVTQHGLATAQTWALLRNAGNYCSEPNTDGGEGTDGGAGSPGLEWLPAARTQV